MYEDLSGIQIMILDYIKEALGQRGYPPSVREICTAVDLASTSSVHHQLNNLEKKGYIRRDPLKPRALEILKNNPFAARPDVVEVPVIGTVTAGEPITAFEDYTDTFPLPASFVKNNNCFMLNVKGSSMINAGILDGDQVIVKQQNVAEDGDYVVAMIEDEATVKTFYREDGRIRLQPENPMMAPIFARNVDILGIVIGVFRKI
ncbi:MAG: transcriptional repressor LexA [Eubacteriaceae bacterium]|jgi:repressor LexA|nr:transcriptional repressor LexA [Eubacteriaceae bacterium]